jgi:Ca-activated chloride channel family protein
MPVEQLIAEINQYTDEGGSSIKLFTIGFGDDADKGILQSIADPTGGRQYDATPENINTIYQEIATFF